MIDDFIWSLMKNELVKGLDDDRKENMREVFDLVRDRFQDDDFKILLPIVRRVYPTLSEILKPKDFVDRLHEKINVGLADFVKNNILIFYTGLWETFYFKTHCDIFGDTLKNNNNNIDIEAELMASIAVIMVKEFEEEFEEELRS